VCLFGSRNNIQPGGKISLAESLGILEKITFFLIKSNLLKPGYGLFILKYS